MRKKMKQKKQFLIIVMLVFFCSMAVKADAKAAQVTGVKQKSDSVSSVTISCDAILGMNYYVVQLSTDNSNWKVKANSTDPNSIFINGLNAGQTYYVRVFGSSGYEYEDNARVWKVSATYSDSIEVVTTPHASSSDITAVQTDADKNKVSVYVSPVDGANYYILMYKSQIIGQGASSTVTTQNSLDPGGRYNLYAYACRKSNTGYIAKGSHKSVAVKTLAPKIKKRDFYMDVNASKYSYYVNTSCDYDVDGYYYEFYNAYYDIHGTVKKIYGPSSSQFVSQLEGYFYKYRVRTYVNCNGKRIYSAWSNFRRCGRPKAKSVYAVKKGNKIKLCWGLIIGVDGYDVYVSDKKNSGYKKIKSIKVKDVGHSEKITISKVKGKKLKKNKFYYFRIVPKSKEMGGKADDYILCYCKFK